MQGLRCQDVCLGVVILAIHHEYCKHDIYKFESLVIGIINVYNVVYALFYRMVCMYVDTTDIGTYYASTVLYFDTGPVLIHPHLSSILVARSIHHLVKADLSF